MMYNETQIKTSKAIHHRAVAFPRIPSSQADNLPLLHIYSSFDMNLTLFSRYVSRKKKNNKTNAACWCYLVLIWTQSQLAAMTAFDKNSIDYAYSRYWYLIDKSAEVHDNYLADVSPVNKPVSRDICSILSTDIISSRKSCLFFCGIWKQKVHSQFKTELFITRLINAPKLARLILIMHG